MPDTGDSEGTRAGPPIELVGNALCLDFVNTLSARPAPTWDHLAVAESLMAWAAAVGRPLDRVSPRALAAGLPAIRELRDDIHAVFDALVDGQPAPVDRLGRVLDEYAVALRHASWRLVDGRLVPDWQTLRDPGDLAWPLSSSAVDLLREGPLDRLGRCPGCGWLFLDTSRNGQRRWCSMATCGSRTKAARYYARSTKGVEG